MIRPSGEEQSSELFGNWYGPVDSEEGLPAVCLISVFTQGTSWQEVSFFSEEKNLCVSTGFLRRLFKREGEFTKKNMMYS